MRPVLYASIMILAMTTACHKDQPVPPILQPIVGAACAVESAITGAAGAEIVSECQGTDSVACGAALQGALGNVNLCALQVPVPASTPQLSSLDQKYGKVGDVSAGDLDAAKKGVKAQAVKPAGIVGAIACPAAINAVLGLLTSQVPAACGCKQNLSAGTLGDLLKTACVAAVPL